MGIVGQLKPFGRETMKDLPSLNGKAIYLKEEGRRFV
jgi:hypothetical protein